MQEVTLFNVIISLLMLLFGFLLNRVFSQLDGNAKEIAALQQLLPSDYVKQADFIRHADQEMHLMERMSVEINKRFDKIDILLEAMRVRNQIGGQ